MPNNKLLTSVVAWTRYDGSPETLPPMNSHVLYAGYDGVEVMWYSSKPSGRKWVSLDGEEFDFEKGDVWARLPGPPEDNNAGS